MRKNNLKILSIILISFLTHNVISQNWNGSEKWVYKMDNFYPFNQFQYYHEIKIIGDTIINNKACSILEEISLKTNSGVVEDTFSYRKYFMIYEDGIISNFYQNLDDFRVLYDFNKVNNDTFLSYCEFEDDYYQIEIDSVTNFQSSVLQLKVFHINPNGQNIGCLYEGEIIEEIGSTNYFFPLLTTVDPPVYGKLQCYTKNGVEHAIFGNCDDLVNTAKVQISIPEINPNPFTNNININSSIPLKYSLSNLNGLVIKEGIADKTILTSNLNPGIYFLKLFIDDKFYTYKLVNARH